MGNGPTTTSAYTSGAGGTVCRGLPASRLECPCDLFWDNELEAFQVWRTIRFVEFKVRVREAILAQLNEAIAIAGEVVGFDAAVEFEGLPTLQDVEGGQG